MDSNIAIYFLNGKLTPKAEAFLNPILQQECNLSVITKMEVLGHKFLTQADREDAEAFVQASRVIPLSDTIVETTIAIRQGQNIKLPDAIIAATALVNNFTLVTRNISDFSIISGLNIVNPMN